MASTWASIVKRVRPAVQIADPNETQKTALGQKISQKNAAAHAKVLAKVAATHKRKAEWKMMDRNGAQLAHYEDLDLVRAFAARIKMTYDAGGLTKDLAGDLCIRRL